MKLVLRSMLATTIAFSMNLPAADDSTLDQKQLPEKDKLDLYVLMGQSNMAGRGEVETEDKTPHERVLVFTTNSTWQLAVEPITLDPKKTHGVGPGVAFGKAMADRNPGRVIGLVPCAVGGTKLSRWEPGADLYSNAVYRARAAMKYGFIKGFLWHQGESDSNPEDSKTYGERLVKMIQQLRTDLESLGAPFVTGQLGEFLFTRTNKPNAFAREINQTLANLPAKLTLTGCAESKGLNHKGDVLHFASASQREFGRRYAEKMQALQKEAVPMQPADPAPAQIKTRSDSRAQTLRIIVFGAHPDDCELNAGGVAPLWAAQGHAVKFVNTTCGDAGHWRESGSALAQRRKSEVAKAAEVLSIATETLDTHDGQLMPTLENRHKIIRLIREWKADIVISPRPYDYHPDHRYTGVLVQDAAFMVIVPAVCPTVPILKRNPVFLFNSDRFHKPIPFKPDIAIALDSVIEKKIDALSLLESQFMEGGCLGSEAIMPQNANEREARAQLIRRQLSDRFKALADKYRSALVDRYGEEKGSKVGWAEVFEICEYGRQPTAEDLKQLFPF